MANCTSIAPEGRTANLEVLKWLCGLVKKCGLILYQNARGYNGNKTASCSLFQLNFQSLNSEVLIKDCLKQLGLLKLDKVTECNSKQNTEGF